MKQDDWPLVSCSIAIYPNMPLLKSTACFSFEIFTQVLNDLEKVHPMVVPVSMLVGSLGLFCVLGTCCVSTSSKNYYYQHQLLQELVFKILNL